MALNLATVLQVRPPFVTLREAANNLTCSPAGAHPSGRFGEEPKGRPGNLLPLLAHMACGRVKESTLKVFGNDYPTQ